MSTKGKTSSSGWADMRNVTIKGSCCDHLSNECGVIISRGRGNTESAECQEYDDTHFSKTKDFLLLQNVCNAFFFLFFFYWSRAVILAYFEVPYSGFLYHPN